MKKKEKLKELRIREKGKKQQQEKRRRNYSSLKNSFQ